MTKSEAVRRKLAADIEAYLCGEVPNPLDMQRAAKLENWLTEVRRRGAEFVLVVKGDVHQHMEIEKGQPIGSAAVMWFDRKSRFVRTTNRLYALGQPAGDNEGIDA
jgi:hypothetical protein